MTLCLTSAQYRELVAQQQRRGGRAPHGRGVAVAGWREFGGQRSYYRSKAEMRVAAYLEWQRSRGEIQSWVHEPETFWFSAIRRGVVSYKPDFRAVGGDGAVVYWEVKGWMDSRSKTALNRMAKYHPTVKLHVIGTQWFKDHAMLVGIVPGWEA